MRAIESRLFGRPTRSCRAPLVSRTRLSLEAVEDRCVPAVLSVNAILDTASPNDPYLSLREAIAIVHNPTLPGGLSAGITERITGTLHENGADTIVFDADLGGLIVLANGQLNLSVASGTTRVTIDGGGVVTIDGNNASRVFSVASGADLTLTDLTVAHGNTGMVFSGPGGGGVLNAGTLTVDRGTFTDNQSRGFMQAGGGGAVANTGTLTVIDSTFTGNVAGTSGGGSGLYNAGTATVVGSTFAGNGLSGSTGGAITVNSGQVSVLNSTFSGNRGKFGSAIFVGTGAVTVVDSTFANNNDSGPGGNGVIYAVGSVTAINSVFSGNTAGGGPGTAIDADNGGRAPVTVNNSVNTAVVLAALADNGGPTRTHAPLPGSPTIGTGVAPTTVNTPVTSTVAPTLIVGNASVLGVVPGYTVILVGTEQLLVTAVSGSTLTVVRGYNGTTAATHDEDDAVYPATDQRGVSRLTNGTSDIGAFQSAATESPPSIDSPTTPNGRVGQAYSFTPTVSGGTPAFTFSIAAGTLPDGLALAADTGVISGTPTAAGSAEITLSVTDAEGLTDSQSYTLTVVASPALTGSNNTITAGPGGAAVAVDPNLTIAANGLATLSRATVSITGNFDPSEDELLFTDQNGITGSYNAANGVLTLTGTASVADYQAAMRSVQYRDTDGAAPNSAQRTISFSIAPAVFNPANGHFYEFVVASGISWTAARAEAETRSLFGLQGYLATLTSQAENDFAFSKVEGLGWIGASDAAVEGDWRWVGGPEAGTQFWSGGPGSGKGAAGTPVNGEYSNWASGEPNNAGNEDYAHFQPSGMWNDYPDAATVSGYVVEYGGSDGDPTLMLTSQTRVNVVNSTAAPVVTSPVTAQSVNAATALVQGTAVPFALVQVYRDVNNNGAIDAGDTVVASQQLGGSTGFSIVVPLEQDAANNFLVTSTLTPLAESLPVDVPTVTEDSTAPVATTVTAPATPQVVNAATYTIQGTAEPFSLVRVYRDSNSNGILDEGDTVVGQQEVGDATGLYGVVVPLEQDAANRFLVTSTDAAGNESAAALVPTVTEDSTAPASAVVTTPATPLVVNAATATVAGTAEPFSLVRVYRDANNNGVLDAGDTVVGQQEVGDGTDFSIVVLLEQDAVNRFLVTSTDAAANESAAALVPTVTEDSTAPAAPAVITPATAITVNAATATVAGTAEAGSLVLVYRDANNNGVIDAGDTVVGSQQLGAGVWVYGVVVPLDQDADNWFLVTSTDAAGNESAATAVPTVTEDSTAPVAPVVTAPATPQIVNAATYTIQGTAEPFSLVRVYRDANSNGILDDGDTVVGQQQLGDEFDFSIAVPLDQDADNRFLVTSTDAAANESAAAPVPTVIEDSTAPVAPLVSAPTTPVVVNAPSVVVTGTVEVGSLVRVYRDANNNGILDEGDTVVGQQQLGDATAFSIAVPLEKDAANRFLVTSTDAAGNESAAAPVPTVTEDSTAPTAPVVITPAARVATPAGDYTVTGRAEANGLVQVYRDENNNGVIDPGEQVVGQQQLSESGTAYAITIPLVPNAVNHFLVVVSDAAGNRSAGAAVPNVVQGYPDPGVPRGFAVGADEGGRIARLYNPDGSVRLSIDPFPNGTGGVRVSTADVNGDGVPDLVVGSGPGQVAEVRVYDGSTGAVLYRATPFGDFTGGVFVEAADLTGDGRADLLVTPDEGGGARVMVIDGATGTVLADFFGIDDPNFRGGARVAAGDVTGDGVPDVIVAAGFGGGPRVTIYDGAALRGGVVRQVANFFVFEPTLRNGVYVAAGDIDGDGYADVIAGGGPGGGPRVFAVSGKALMETGVQVPVANFFAGDVTSRNGVRVATADLDLDGLTDVIAGSGEDEGAQVTVYLGKDIRPTGTPPATFDFDAFENLGSPGLFAGGVFVG